MGVGGREGFQSSLQKAGVGSWAGSAVTSVKQVTGVGEDVMLLTQQWEETGKWGIQEPAGSGFIQAVNHDLVAEVGNRTVFF